jgi:hypothetical protein
MDLQDGFFSSKDAFPIDRAYQNDKEIAVLNEI